jgi:hypothetical protein
MARVRKTDSERDEAIARLREWLKPGDTVHTVLRHVSRSGMSREIDVVKIEGPDDVRWLSGVVSRADGWRLGKRDGIVVGGCGMDMGFHLVYSLSYALFKDGFGCVGEGCPSNDHVNGDRDYTPHGCRMCAARAAAGVWPSPVTRERPAGICTDDQWREHWHRDGGYALRQRWI